MSTKNTRGPLIAFGSGGLLGAYYIGVISFIRDHFDLIKSDISISGISCGSFAAFIVFLELSVEQSIEYLFMLKNLFSNRTLSIFFNATSDYLAPWHVLTTSFNKTDDFMQKQYDKFSIYFGCSRIGLNRYYFPSLSQLLMGHNKPFKTIKEMMYSMTISSRILPFYRSFGKWNHHKLLFDGGATQNFAISDEDKNNRQIIAITAWSNKSLYNLCGVNEEDTICPDPNKEIWSIGDIIKYDSNLKQQIQRYKIGYLAAAKLCNVKNMINKGLIWNNNNQYNMEEIHDEKKWNQHIEDLMHRNIDKLNEYFQSLSEEKCKRQKGNCCSSFIYIFFLCIFVMIIFV